VEAAIAHYLPRDNEQMETNAAGLSNEDFLQIGRRGDVVFLRAHKMPESPADLCDLGHAEPAEFFAMTRRNALRVAWALIRQALSRRS